MQNFNPKVLLVSNGYGEDTVAATIGVHLKKKLPNIKLEAFPTVGNGTFYKKAGITTVFNGVLLPSEGFIRSFGDFINDLTHGFFTKTIKMGLKLKSISNEYDFIIPVGDPYILLFTSIFSVKKRRYKIFVGIQQSEWYQSKKPFKEHYSFIERLWMKMFAGLIFVRDKKTADYLTKKGFNNVFSFGNPMMDCFIINQEKVFPPDRIVIGILPGSKKEAYENLKVTFKILENLSDKIKNPIFAIATSPNLSKIKIITDNKLKKTKKGSFSNNNINVPIFSKSGIKGDIVITDKLFGDIINESIVIIGTSGTANEQAAGMGKAIFSFWGKGPQLTKKFLDAQKRLLGKSLFVFEPNPPLIAEKIVEVINDKKLLKEIEINGKMRMAGRGSIDKIAGKIINYMINCKKENINL